MNGFTKEQVLNLLDAYVPDSGAMIQHIGVMGTYIQLKYAIFSENGMEEVEEFIRPNADNSCMVLSKAKDIHTD